MIHLCGKEAVQFTTKDTAIALGKFDGIHIGHQLLLEGLKKEKQKGFSTLVFSFEDHPNSVLKGELRKTIYTSPEKAYYFSQLDVDILLEYPFTKEFAAISPEEFISVCLVDKLKVKSIYVGEDFCFGRNRSGNISTLREAGRKYNFQVHVVPKVKLNQNIVSSTFIRETIPDNFSLANQMLGNPYFIYGEITHGQHLGHSLGFPTINQTIPGTKIIPACGVYASRIWIDKTPYRGISNLGKKPTIEGEHQIGLETHIFNYDGDLYGQYVKTELLWFVREEIKFHSLEDLKSQIEKDTARILNA